MEAVAVDAATALAWATSAKVGSNIQLRVYQQKLATDILAAFDRSPRVLGVAPTGSGKTIVFSHLASIANNAGQRVVIVAHRKEIVDQISAALTAMRLHHGVIQPGSLVSDDPIQVAMVQTLVRRLDGMKAPSLMVLDEAHHAVAGSWQALCEAWPGARILGMTATPMRLDGRGLSDVFDELVVGPSVRALINQGFLSGFDYFAPPQLADLSGIKTRAGDYAIEELAAVVDRPTITGDAIAHYKRHLQGRTAVAFCITVEHARNVAAQFRAAGVSAESIEGAMTSQDRAQRISGIRSGKLKVLTSCELISEGTDLPAVSGAILLRPTKSLALHLQQVGRAMRPNAGGQKTAILDHVGNLYRHGLPDEDRTWSLTIDRKKKSAPDVMTCSVCDQTFARSEEKEPCADVPRCIFAPQEIAARREAQLVAGDLRKVDPAEAERIRYIRTTPLSIVMQDAETRQQIAEVARIRGYGEAWVDKVISERERVRGEEGRVMVKEIYCHNGDIALVDDEDFEQISQYEWSIDVRGCPYRQEKTNGKVITFRISHEVLKPENSQPVFYKTKNYLDNRRSNLTFERTQKKPENQSLNVAKSGPRCGKRFKGINFDSRAKRSKGPYLAYLTLNGTRKFLGSFPTDTQAARAYDAAAFAAWGADCFLNFPEDYGLPPRNRAKPPEPAQRIRKDPDQGNPHP